MGSLAAPWLALCSPGALQAQVADPVFPDGFVVEEIGSNWALPVALCFIDGARLLVAEKRGRLWYVENKVKKNVVIALEDEVLSSGDRGLLGIAADPQFDLNGYVYLLMGVDPNGDGVDDEQESFSRLVRFTTAYDGSGNLLADPASRIALLGQTWSTGIPSLSFGHATGRLAFMSDGSLLVSHGDGAHYVFTDGGGLDPDGFGPDKFSSAEDIGAFRSQERGSLGGKILRIDPATGLGLPDNPFFTGDPADLASRVWAIGLRNPFRFTLVPGTAPPEALFVCDVGNDRWEEINLCRGGENFGWPCYEGAPQEPDYQALDPFGYCVLAEFAVTDPWLAWHHTAPGILDFVGTAATGVCVYSGTSYPPVYHGALFFCDYTEHWMKVATLDENLDRTALLSFGTNLGSPIDIQREPLSGDLVYISLGIPRRILRLRYAPSNLPPVAVATATPSWGPVPLTVELSAAGSYDPEGDPLDYSWDLGDGTSSVSPEVTKIYTSPDTHVVVLTVTDDLGNQATRQILINSANSPPAITSVASPADGGLYAHGEPVLLECAAVDAEDDLAGTPLQVEWSFDLVHDHHVHPDWASVSGFAGSWTPEEHGEGSYGLRLNLTVTDSRGLSDARSFQLYDNEATPLPHVVSVSNTPPRLGIPVTALAHVDYLTPPGTPPATLTFDWDDGTSDVFTDAAHQVDQQATHTYAAPGTYTLRVVASDGARSSESTTTIQVGWADPAVAVFVPVLAEGNMTWLEQVGVATRLKARLGSDVSVFQWDQQSELVGWMQASLADGVRDILVLMDFAPALVFAGEAEGSLAEQWLENGNGIVWTGAPPFAASMAEDRSTSVWGVEAVDGLLDAEPGVCQAEGVERLTPLARRLLPYLTATHATNAVRLDRLGPEWSAVRVFAKGRGKESDAVELGHTAGGLYAQFYCIPGSGLPRAQVLTDFVHLLLPKKADRVR
jgi:glucose/arabinose dehydrogenase